MIKDEKLKINAIEELSYENEKSSDEDSFKLKIKPVLSIDELRNEISDVFKDDFF